MKLLLALSFPLLLAGCSSLSYYGQAVMGHVRLMAAARPIPEWLADPATPAGLRVKLSEVDAMRAFASRDLGLPDNGSYRTYADLKRPFVVWNVFAADEFSVVPRQWCMLVVGCVGYRGYFDQARAEALAAELAQQGLDAWVGGVPAYSTLGHFDDPVLNTFLRYGQDEVARTLFHELAHQEVFAEGDTAFNESFASVVEDEGVARWLAAHGTTARLAAFEERQRRKKAFAALVEAYRKRLGEVYEQKTMPPEDMRAAKAATIREMRAAYGRMKAGWGGWAGYDFWFAGPLNNAQLASIALYQKWQPAFRALLQQENGDLPRFYLRVQALAGLPGKERQKALEALMPPGGR